MPDVKPEGRDRNPIHEETIAELKQDFLVLGLSLQNLADLLSRIQENNHYLAIAIRRCEETIVNGNTFWMPDDQPPGDPKNG